MNARVLVALGLAVAISSAAALTGAERRLTPSDVDLLPGHDSGAGTSGVAGIRTTLIAGDPSKAGPYTIRLRVPANTRIQAHTHRDDRSAVVISGVWYFGYGPMQTEAGEKALPPGSFYTEPSGAAHFAETKSEPV
jgi:quercetin dioxygenase-like cupin family protein